MVNEPMLEKALPGLQHSGPNDGSAEYTEHTEPLEQGGERYVRCEGCGRELLIKLGGRDNLLHKKICPNARPNRRAD